MRDKQLSLDSMDIRLSYHCNNKYYNIQLNDTAVQKCDGKEIMSHKFRYESIDLLKNIVDSFKNNRAGGVDQSV